MRNYGAIWAEIVVEMVGGGEVQGDMTDAITSGIIVALIKSLD